MQSAERGVVHTDAAFRLAESPGIRVKLALKRRRRVGGEKMNAAFKATVDKLAVGNEHPLVSRVCVVETRESPQGMRELASRGARVTLTTNSSIVDGKGGITQDIEPSARWWACTVAIAVVKKLQKTRLSVGRRSATSEIVASLIAEPGMLNAGLWCRS